MRAFLDRQEIMLESVEFDRERWAQPRTRGNKNLYVELAEADLVAIGSTIFNVYRGHLAEDEDYFKDEMLAEVPKPRDARVFADKPMRLRQFLRPGSFWRDATIKAVMTCMNPWNVRITAPVCRVEELTDVKVDEETGFVILILGVRVPNVPR